MMQTPPPPPTRSKYGPSYGTPSYVERRRSNAESTPLSPSSTTPIWSNVDMRPSQYYSAEVTPGRHRIRRRSGDRMAKWTTRLVLASPLMVLFLWSLALVLHAGKTVESAAVQQQSKLQAVRVPVRPKKKNKIILNKPHRAVQQQKLVVQPRAAASATQTKYVPAESKGEPPLPVIAPLGVTAGVVPLQQQQQPAALGTSNARVVARPRPKPRGASQFNTNQAMMATENNSANLLTASSQFVAGNQMMEANNENAMQKVDGTALQATEEAGNSLQATEQQQQQAVSATAQQQQNAVGATQQQQNTMGRRSPKIYYYDAAASIKNGQLFAPDVVYAEDGTPVKLASLHDGRTEIYLQPPVLGSTGESVLAGAEEVVAEAMGGTQQDAQVLQQQEAQALGATQQEDQAMGATPQDAQALGATQRDAQALGNSQETAQAMKLNLDKIQQMPQQAQDQWIIIATVATMALLVGALSARRLRSRQFLASCIENESLEDELAYDTAYTGSYDTFAHWKGDLEKFDV